MLESQITSMKAMLHIICRPPPEGYKFKIWFYFPQPQGFLVNPALCAHTVVMFGNGPALVPGIEGKLDNATVRLGQVLNYYSFVLRREAQKYLTRYGSDSAVLKKTERAKKPVTALQDQLECLQYDQKNQCKLKQRGAKAYGSKMKPRTLSFQRNKQNFPL